MKDSRANLIAFVIFCSMSFYSYGTAMMDYFLLYPSRFLVGEKEFVAYHALLEGAIVPISVVPFLAIILLNILLVWFRPVGVSRTLILISLICLLLDLGSTLLLQAPWNFELGNGKNVALMQKITDTNWIRVFLESVQAIVAGVLVYKRCEKPSGL